MGALEHRRSSWRLFAGASLALLLTLLFAALLRGPSGMMAGLTGMPIVLGICSRGALEGLRAALLHDGPGRLRPNWLPVALNSLLFAVSLFSVPFVLFMAKNAWLTQAR